MTPNDPGPLGAIALQRSLHDKDTRKVGAVVLGERCAELRLAADSLWVVISGERHPVLAVRAAWSPGPDLQLIESGAKGLRLRSALGEHCCEIVAHRDVLQIRSSLCPAAPVRVEWWPRDLYPLGEKLDPMTSSGEVLAAQRGLNTALLYARLDGPGEGTFFYQQDLTSLNDYFNRTGTAPDGVVGGTWPELGYLPPSAREQPLPAEEEVILSDAYLRFDPRPVENHQVEARVFLDHQAAIYPLLQKPDVEFRDWPTKAAETVRDLDTCPMATTVDGGYRYGRPYVNAEYPDSMVQTALTNMLREYANWTGRPLPLMDEFRAGIYRFFDPEIGAVRRYLGSVGEDKDKDAVDSWYLYHPLQGLARLAKAGDDEAREIFLGSMDYAIKVARAFEYRWPIQFSLSTLQIKTASRNPGAAIGQTDAGGLYAYVMLDAFEMTGDEKYLQEARSAIEATRDLEFELAYQTNLTSWGAAACLRLWKATGEQFYLDQTSVFAASFFHNCTIWNSKIGKTSEARTFLGVTCLHDGPYLAPYECYESVCAFDECLAIAEKDLPPSCSLLMAEFFRYALDRGWFFYPSSLRPTSLAHSQRNGVTSRNLAFPLEDLYVNGSPAGQVGQEIYGAGAAIAYATHAFHPLAQGHFYCEYPVRKESARGAGTAFTVLGPPGGRCSARILPSKGAIVTVDGKAASAECFEVNVGSKVRIRRASRANAREPRLAVQRSGR